ncbi:hypothetical protein GCM10009821_25650 [Aeromicrobium halocynthiae]|uniref:Holin-like toxin n=1 Tax=Aeromicrobium halocynthiae TaxID=560557 RepID=A0ABN2W5B7_9ACTN
MLTTILQAAEEGAEESNFLLQAIGIGALAFGFLMLLLIALLVFGKGREHT